MDVPPHGLIPDAERDERNPARAIIYVVDAGAIIRCHAIGRGLRTVRAAAETEPCLVGPRGRCQDVAAGSHGAWCVAHHARSWDAPDLNAPA